MPFNINKSACFLLLLTLAWHSSQAQGYQGFNWTVEANISSFISLTGPTWNNRGLATQYPYVYVPPGTEGRSTFALSNQYKMTITNAYQRNKAISFEYAYIPTAVNIDFRRDSLVSIDGVFRGVNISDDLLYQLPIHAFNLNFLFFGSVKKGNLAPMGSFFKLGIGFYAGNGKFADGHTTTDGERVRLSENNLPNIFANAKTNFFAPTINLGYHNRTIFAERFTFRIGADMGIVLAKGFGNAYFSAPSEDFRDEYIKSINARVGRLLVVNINVGMGYLLF